MRYLILVTALEMFAAAAAVLWLYRMWLVLRLWKSLPGVALLHALLIPAIYFFRLKNDGTIDDGLVKAARLHDKMVKGLLYIVGVAFVLLGAAVASKYPLFPLP